MNEEICLVEDEKDLNQMLTFYLKNSNYKVTSCKNIQEALNVIDKKFKLWILDIMLPDGNGLELMKLLKQKSKDNIVIIISAKGDCFDRVTGFEIGCDDYISKPFLPTELIYRVKNLIKQNRNIESDEIIFIDPYTINFTKRIINENEIFIEITSREFEIINFFIKNKGKAISRETLLNEIWGNDYFGSDRTVDNYIKNIRKKLPKLKIETIYGFGYRYNI